ncbi:MAG: 3-hydroxyacyl-CoA dehydrogenase NAD-binding domain-containing protein, partial [Bauldia sp.]
MEAPIIDELQPDAARVRVEMEGSVAVVVIDNPPVNAASTAVRRGLVDAVTSLARLQDVTAAVLIGAGRTFIAGSDIREFDKPLVEPQLPAVIAAIEACPKPVVAAIHGAALGGGFEVALACDARIAAADAVVGLPEVKLGMIPGAGGTQRLPRLIGVAGAVEMIGSGRRVPAGEALSIGLVDQIGDGDLRAAAVALAQTLTAKRPVSAMEVARQDDAAIEEAAAAAARANRGIGAVREAIAAVRMAATLPFAEALAKERETFQRLRNGEESRALRHLFFAERRALRGPAGVATRPVEQAGVVGLGLMGSGIAAGFAVAGLEVLAVEEDETALRRGMERTGEVIRSIGKRTRLSADRVDAALARVHPVAGLAGLAAVDLVVEAVVEDFEVKKAVFGDLDRLLRSGAIVASNTSYLDIDAMAAATHRAADVAGLHFFSPPHVMRLVEVVRGAATAPEVIATLVGLGRRLGKVPVVARASEGFIGNRILSAYRQQCDFLLEEGAYPEAIDAALTGFGMAMGPYAVADLAGLDIAWRMRRRRAATRDPGARYFPAADRLCEMGRFGRK